MGIPRLGIIGISGFGRAHYDDLLREQAAGRIALTAATIINQGEEAERCARLARLGCALFTDHRAMLDAWRGRLDLVCIPTGIHLHAPMACDCLAAGANAFIEKPAAATMQDVRRMQAAERQHGRFIAVGYQTMYASETLVMKRALLAGRLGKVRRIACRGLWPRDQAYYRRNGWAGRLKADGHWVLDSPFNNAIAHQLNMCLFLAGPTERASCTPLRVQAELGQAHGIESADTAALRIHCAEGPEIIFLATHCSAGSLDPEIRVDGDAGHLLWTFRTLTIRDQDGTEEVLDCEGPTLRQSLWRSLLARLAGDDRFLCGLEVAGTQTLVVNGAHLSAAVQTAPAGLVRQEVRPDGKVSTIIDGIDTQIAEAFQRGCLLSETGCVWLRPGRVVEVAWGMDFI